MVDRRGLLFAIKGVLSEQRNVLSFRLAKEGLFKAVPPIQWFVNFLLNICLLLPIQIIALTISIIYFLLSFTTRLPNKIIEAYFEAWEEVHNSPDAAVGKPCRKIEELKKIPHKPTNKFDENIKNAEKIIINLHEIFETIQKRIMENLDNIPDLNIVYQFVITDGNPKDWILHLTKRECHVSMDFNCDANCTIIVTSNVLLNSLERKEEDLLSAYLRGRLDVSGDLSSLLKLNHILCI